MSPCGSAFFLARAGAHHGRQLPRWWWSVNWSGWACALRVAGGVLDCPCVPVGETGDPPDGRGRTARSALPTSAKVFPVHATGTPWALVLKDPRRPVRHATVASTPPQRHTRSGACLLQMAAASMVDFEAVFDVIHHTDRRVIGDEQHQPPVLVEHVPNALPIRHVSA